MQNRNNDLVTDRIISCVNVNEIIKHNGYSYSPLELAILNCNIRMFNILLKSGSDFNFINSSGDSCLRLAYLNASFYTYYNIYDIIFGLFHRGVIIDDKARNTIENRDERPRFKLIILSCLEKIDQATNGNIEYFKKLLLDPLLIKNIKIWVNYLPEATYRELLLWAKPKLPEQISTLFGKTLTDRASNRESIAIPGLPASNIIEYIISPKYLEIRKKFYDELVRLRLYTTFII